MLATLVSNSWPQVICPPQPLKVLALQVWATAPSLYFNFFSSDRVLLCWPRLVSNCWPQVICPPWLPKVLGLQARATVPGPCSPLRQEIFVWMKTGRLEERQVQRLRPFGPEAAQVVLKTGHWCGVVIWAQILVHFPPAWTTVVPCWTAYLSGSLCWALSPCSCRLWTVGR